jgi:predicted Holliday junction resolvase-like endonuclease
MAEALLVVIIAILLLVIRHQHRKIRQLQGRVREARRSLN